MSVSNQGAQESALPVLQSAATADGNGTAFTADGYNGGLFLWIFNGAGTTTLTVEGCLDGSFATQKTAVLGVVKLWDSGAGTNVSRSTVSGALSVAANTSYLFSIVDPSPSLRARLSSSAGLGAGTNVTGCTALLNAIPV